MTSHRWILVGGLLGVVAATTVLLGVALARSAAPSGSDPLIGSEAPPVSGRTLDGSHLTMRAGDGRVTVVNIWASWCGPCREELPRLAEIGRRWADRGVDLVTVDTRDGPVAARSLLEEVGAEGLVAVQDPDGRTAVAWGATGVPETFVVDGDGVVRARQVGAISASWLEAELSEWTRRAGADRKQADR